MGAIAEGGVEVLSERRDPRPRHSARARRPGRRARAARAGAPRSALPRRPPAPDRSRPHRHPRRRRPGHRRDDGGGRPGAARSGSRRAIVVAVPVGARETCERLGRIADERRLPGDAGAVQRGRPVVRGLRADDRRRSRRAARGRRTRRASTASGRARRRPIRSTSSAGARMPLDRRPVASTTRCSTASATRASCCSARPRTARTSSTASARSSRRRLIAEKGFTAVAVEADWPDAYRVNRYVRGDGADEDAVDALGDFGRFPTWMWRNADVLDFVGWLRAHNETQPAERAGRLLRPRSLQPARVDAGRARVSRQGRSRGRAARARRATPASIGSATRCRQYGYAAGARADAVVRARGREPAGRAAPPARRVRAAATAASRADEFFFAEQNARLVRNAEEYYRTMFGGRVESWNLRDRHMAETLGELLQFLERTRPRRARRRLGAQLAPRRRARDGDGRGRRAERRPARARALRRATRCSSASRRYTGTVTAASEWDGPAQRKHVRPALAGSYERLFHDAGIPRFLLPLRTRSRAGVGAGRRRGSSAPSASSTCRRPSGAATTSTRGCPSSSTTCCTSTRRAPSSRSSGPRAGKPARSPRRSRPACEGATHDRDGRTARDDRRCACRSATRRLRRATSTRPAGRRAGSCCSRTAAAAAATARGTSSSPGVLEQARVRHAADRSAHAGRGRRSTARPAHLRFDIELLARAAGRRSSTGCAAQPDTASLPHRPVRREHRRRRGARGGGGIGRTTSPPSCRAAAGPTWPGTRCRASTAPTLLIVGGLRHAGASQMNRAAMARMRGQAALEIVPGATHLFEEPGALQRSPSSRPTGSTRISLRV